MVFKKSVDPAVVDPVGDDPYPDGDDPDPDGDDLDPGGDDPNPTEEKIRFVPKHWIRIGLLKPHPDQNNYKLYFIYFIIP